MGAAQEPVSGGRRTALSEINVTPLVDVMLVLLIIFMVTAPMMQQGIEVDLPKTGSTGLEVPEDPLVLVIKRDRSLFIGQVRVPASELRTRLQGIFSTRKNKQIFIQADKDVAYGSVAETMAEIRSSGISQIGLVTLPKDN